MSDQVEELQIRIAFLEDELRECLLAQVRQQAEMTELRKILSRLEIRVRDLSPSPFGSASDEPPPPHY